MVAESLIFYSVDGICRATKCTRKSNTKGYCPTHYGRYKYGQDIDAPIVYRGANSRAIGRPNCTEMPEYQSYKNMLKRCYYPGHKNYKNWGGRGIAVCDEWRKSFWAFYDYIGERPSPKHSVDRIDNDGNYEPGNVRWATPKEQANNKRPMKKREKL